ncbi:MAG: NhaP-type Na+/H+ or K+/H+ antiporter [Psychromonas sp.]|jgi:NhaP-type Na+/H+ or K+/H+ antiporter|uniref:cation:proton antiporter domain-containing protein n=1 Tax=Psychromonas sp. TaxID=1884585 RepID=UPI0039E318F8
MHLDSSVLIVIFVILSLLFGALIKSVSKTLSSPYCVILLLAGLSLGFFGRTAQIQANFPGLKSALTNLAEVDPHLILLLFLPTLIFESAFSMDPHLFKRISKQIMVLAVPGLILSTLLTAVFTFYLFPWQWSWTVCFLFGALISATDPVAVVSLLKEISSRKRLETLIEGESLLNDGTAIVFFSLFYGLLTSGGQANLNIMAISGSFISVVLLGLLIGLAVGAVFLFWIGRLFNQAIIEITLTISAAYIAYFIAENIFDVSGVVAVVSLGLLVASVGRTRISPEVTVFLHHFWQMMAHIANTLIFILVGIIIASRIRLDNWEWWATLAGLYLGIQIIRALMVFTFMPILKDAGINKNKAIVVIWGGLRGAVSLALALIIAQDNFLAKELGDQILFLTAGIVVLTIVINASSMSLLLRYFGLDKLSEAKQASLIKAQQSIQQHLANDLVLLQQHEFLQRADWKSLSKPRNDAQPVSPLLEADFLVAFRRRLLETERQFYWSQFSQGSLTAQATKHLVTAVEFALDGNAEISPRKTLFDSWKTPAYIRWFYHIPFVNYLVVDLSFERLSLSYDTARGFIQGQEEIQKHLQSLSPSEQDRQVVEQEIENNKKQTRLYIEKIRDNFPELSYSLETYAAHRLLLHLERVYLNDLINQGVFNDSEAKKLTREIEYKIIHLTQPPHHISPKEISKQLALMPWAKGVKEKSMFLLSHLAIRQIYSNDELIFRQNKNASAIALLLHGKVVLISSTHEEIVETGAIIGVYALLSNRFNISAKAITPVELIWLNIEPLKKIIAKDKQLGEMFASHLEHESHRG